MHERETGGWGKILKYKKILKGDQESLLTCFLASWKKLSEVGQLFLSKNKNMIWYVS